MRRGTVSLLVSRLLLGLALVIPLELALMLVNDNSLLEAVEDAIGTGLGTGIGLFIVALCARRYRASRDLTERTLRRPEPGQLAQPPPWGTSSRRYYSPVFEWIVVAVALPLALALAIGATLTQINKVLMVMAWAAVALTGYYLWTLLVTFVDIGPEGIFVRKRRKSRLTAWEDLVEIRWAREAGAAYPFFCADDGTQVKSPFGVAEAGIGRKRMLRLLNDVELAWRWQVRGPAIDNADR